MKAWCAPGAYWSGVGVFVRGGGEALDRREVEAHMAAEEPVNVKGTYWSAVGV